MHFLLSLFVLLTLVNNLTGTIIAFIKLIT